MPPLAHFNIDHQRGSAAVETPAFAAWLNAKPERNRPARPTQPLSLGLAFRAEQPTMPAQPSAINRFSPAPRPLAMPASGDAAPGPVPVARPAMETGSPPVSVPTGGGVTIPPPSPSPTAVAPPSTKEQPSPIGGGFADWDGFVAPALTQDPLGGTAVSYRDADGRPWLVSDELARCTAFQYNADSRITRVTNRTDPRNKSATYGYDDANRLTSVTDRNGREIVYGYDKANRRTSEDWYDGTTLVNEIDYTYTKVDKILTAADAVSEYAFKYDSANRVTQVDNLGTVGMPHVVLDYEYDNVTSSVKSVADGDDGRVDYTWSPMGRLQTATLQVNATLVASVDPEYDVRGRLESITRQETTAGPTVTTTYGYDDADRLTGITHASSVAGALSAFNYAYDDAGRIESMTDANGTSSYTYDDTNQLIGVSGASTESFTYDQNGNRTMTGYVTGDGNQLLSDGVYDYTYDDEGNTATKVLIGGDELHEYSWDHRNRMTGVQIVSGGTNVTYEAKYTYDVFDRRIGVWTDADGDGSATGVQSWTAYDGNNAWADYDANGDVMRRYLNGRAMDERYARWDAAGTGSTAWYLADNINSVRQIVPPDGTVLTAVTYAAFGGILSETGSGPVDRHRYTGREWDAGSGLYQYRARYYGADAGRFVSEDPIGYFSRDVNLTRYVSNNLLGANDPSGHFATIIGGIIGGAFGGAIAGGISAWFGGSSITGGMVCGAVGGAIAGGAAGAGFPTPGGVAGGMVGQACNSAWNNEPPVKAIIKICLAAVGGGFGAQPGIALGKQLEGFNLPFAQEAGLGAGVGLGEAGGVGAVGLLIEGGFAIHKAFNDMVKAWEQKIDGQINH